MTGPPLACSAWERRRGKAQLDDVLIARRVRPQPKRGPGMLVPASHRVCRQQRRAAENRFRHICLRKPVLLKDGLPGEVNCTYSHKLQRQDPVKVQRSVDDQSYSFEKSTDFGGY